MYARDLDGRRLTLGVSGMLWRRSLVMYDEETNSSWSHILGRAMAGKLKGSQLEHVPSIMTDWETWRTDHPDSTVAWLSRTSREYKREFYSEPRRFVLGIAEGKQASAWGFDALLKTPAINDAWQDTPVVVTFDADSMTPRLFGRRVGDRTLTFEFNEGKLSDRETGTIWHGTTGRAVSGPFSGKHLEAIPAIVSYRNVWRQFHRDSRMTE